MSDERQSVLRLTMLPEPQKPLQVSREELEFLVEQRTIALETANRQLRQEIAQHARVQEQLQMSEERFQGAAQATNDVIWDWDIKSQGIWMNEALFTHFGHRCQMPLSLDWWLSLVHPEDQHRAGTSLQAAIDGKEYWSAE